MAFEKVTVEPGTRNGGVSATLDGKRVFMSAEAFRLVNQPEHVELLVDPSEGLFAIRPASEGEEGVIKVSSAKGSSPSIVSGTLTSKHGIKVGKYSGDFRDGMVIFDTAKPLEKLKTGVKRATGTTAQPGQTAQATQATQGKTRAA